MGALYKGLGVAGVLAIIAFYPLANNFMAGVAAKAVKGAPGFVIPPLTSSCWRSSACSSPV